MAKISRTQLEILGLARSVSLNKADTETIEIYSVEALVQLNRLKYKVEALRDSRVKAKARGGSK